MKYLVSIFLLIFLFACNGNKTPKKGVLVKRSINTVKVVLVPEYEWTWRSIQTIDAHDEQDAIVGNFTGKGIDILYVEEVVEDKESSNLGLQHMARL